MSCSVAISSSAYRHGGVTNLEHPCSSHGSAPAANKQSNTCEDSVCKKANSCEDSVFVGTSQVFFIVP